MTFEKVKSADGTSIAFETVGNGHPVILIGGAFCDRAAKSSGAPLAALLASRFKVVSYDRRARGDSTDTPPYAVEREIDDLAALVDEVGAPAFVYGISSGAMLATEAAIRGVPIAKLALYEPPILLDADRAKGSKAW